MTLHKPTLRKLFPTREAYRYYRNVMEQYRHKRVLAKKRAAQDKSRRRELLVATDDPDDDDYDSVAAGAWQESEG